MVNSIGGWGKGSRKTECEKLIKKESKSPPPCLEGCSCIVKVLKVNVSMLEGMDAAF